MASSPPAVHLPAANLVTGKLWGFDTASQKWAAGLGLDGDGVLSAPPATLKLVTFNVWFHQKSQRERFDGLLAILEEEQPDFVTLQEMTAVTREWILRNPTIRQQYLCSDPVFVTSDNWYGLLTLVAKSTIYVGGAVDAGSGAMGWAYRRYGMDLTTLGRGLLMVTVPISTRGTHTTSVVVGNTHLESPVAGVTSEDRRKQLEVCGAAIRLSTATTIGSISTPFGSGGCSGAGSEGVVAGFLAGDFNFVSDAENQNIPATGFVDCWKEAGPPGTEEGLTFDAKHNANIRGPYRNRPDRIVRLVDTPFTVALIKRVGLNPLPSCNVPPSDHFGIAATFSLTPPPTGNDSGGSAAP